ncbi:MAG TPA: hypothetical protein VFH47_09160 [Candidatus Thermoplasmatota archaeon]|nr:hypothetical protein [Candidatus Thermoplasmatota archaeon]
MPRLLLAVTVASLLLAGCTASDRTRDAAGCFDGAQAFTWFLQPDGSLGPRRPGAQGAVALPGFRNAFLEDAPAPFLSEPLAHGLHILGNVTLRVWLRNEGGPAPMALGGEAGEGYHLFAQVGSDRALAPGYIVEYGQALPFPGTVSSYDRGIDPGAGGFVVEAGHRLRVLLTSLALEDGRGGHSVLVGGARASHVELVATCVPLAAWRPLDARDVDVFLPGNQGLLTGAVPSRENVNVLHVPLDVHPDAQRVSIHLRALSQGEPKDDIDLTVLGADGRTWSGGSPAVDESVLLYGPNLDVLGRNLVIRVDSYSGIDYQGRLSITQDGPA